MKILRCLVDHNRIPDLCRAGQGAIPRLRAPIKVDIQEPCIVLLGVNLEKTILLLLESGEIVEQRCLGKCTRGVVAPAMIPAAEDSRRAFGLLRDWVRAVPADVVECANLSVFPQDEEDTKSRDFAGEVVAGFVEAAAMAYANPCLGSPRGR